MANLEFCDKHNMVAYLKKPTGSEGFQEIVDFLNGSHIRFALTKNPTIYVSLIEKFWQTTTVRRVNNGEQEITAIVNGKEFTITEASVRRHLQLADVEGGSPRCQEAMGVPLLKIDRVKKLEKTVKSNQARRRAKIVVSDDEEDLEDSSKQGRMIEEIDQDAGVTLVTSLHIARDNLKIRLESFKVNKDNGKGIMRESEPEQTKTKLQQRQERAGYEAATACRTYQPKKEIFSQQRAEERRNKPHTQAQQRTYMSNYIKHLGSHTLQQLKRLSFDELKALFETTMRRVKFFHPIESEGDKTVLELTTGSAKRDAEVELDHEGSKKQKTNEASGSVQEQLEKEET
ncbi:hypothetical protein Tco_0966440 [Tanacetum coccineum]